MIDPIDTNGIVGFTNNEPEASFPMYNPDLEFDKVGHEPCFHFRTRNGYFVQAFICDGEIGFMKTKIVP